MITYMAWRGREQKFSASCRGTRSRTVFWPQLGRPELDEPLCFHSVWEGGGAAYTPASGRSPCRDGAWLPAPGSSPFPWVVWLLLVFSGLLRLMFQGFCLFCSFLGLPLVSVETEVQGRSLLISTCSPPTFPNHSTQTQSGLPELLNRSDRSSVC